MAWVNFNLNSEQSVRNLIKEGCFKRDISCVFLWNQARFFPQNPVATTFYSSILVKKNVEEKSHNMEKTIVQNPRSGNEILIVAKT